MNWTSESPRIIIVAGPNGAGKTTLAQEYLPKETGFPDFILNPNAKGWRKMLLAAMEAGKEAKEPQTRAKKAKKGSLKSGSW
ncbi:MAG: ATP-binding protein [Phycisphaerae bacterium]|nr:ATP-binding protein [Phycisphaerae bacterium]